MIPRVGGAGAYFKVEHKIAEDMEAPLTPTVHTQHYITTEICISYKPLNTKDTLRICTVLPYSFLYLRSALHPTRAHCTGPGQGSQHAALGVRLEPGITAKRKRQPERPALQGDGMVRLRNDV